MFRRVVTLLSTVLAAGCYSWEVAPDTSTIEELDGGIRLEVADGTRVTLERYELRGDTVYATAGQCRPAGIFVGTAVRSWCSGIAVAVRDVRRVEIRTVHRRASAVLVLLGGLVGIAFLVALLEMWTGRV